jgi:hypothetical protein
LKNVPTDFGQLRGLACVNEASTEVADTRNIRRQPIAAFDAFEHEEQVVAFQRRFWLVVLTASPDSTGLDLVPLIFDMGFDRFPGQRRPIAVNPGSLGKDFDVRPSAAPEKFRDCSAKLSTSPEVACTFINGAPR